MTVSTTISPEIRPNGIPYHGRFLDAKRQNGQSLGNIANNPPTYGQNNATKNYRELAHVQKLMNQTNLLNSTGTNGHRTRHCYNRRHFMADEIGLNVSENDNSDKATLSGVQTCTCVWTCPVCAPRIAQERASEIKKALDWAKTNGYLPVMVTLTARHNLKTRLADFREKFQSAYTAWNEGGTFYRIKKRVGIKYQIKSVEVTYGDSGWHYHYHILMFVHKKTLMELNDYALYDWHGKMRKHWLYQLSQHGLSAIGEYALNVKMHGNVGEHYLAKLAMSENDQGTNANYELTGNSNKDGRGMTVWRILREAKLNYEQGDKLLNRWGRRYLEYARAMAGQKWITWTPKFKNLVGVNDITDEEAAEQVQREELLAMRELMTIPDDLFRPVRFFCAVPELLSIAGQSKDHDVVLAWLKSKQEKYALIQWQKTDEAIMENNENVVRSKCFAASTPDLAVMMRECKTRINQFTTDMRYYRDMDKKKYEKCKSERNKYNRFYRVMQKEMKSRQLKLF